MEPDRVAGAIGALAACFCELRHAAGGMPNWVMNQRVKELAMEMTGEDDDEEEPEGKK